MNIKNIILMLRTGIILLSSFVIYFFCICHSASFPIMHARWVYISGFVFFNVYYPDTRVSFGVGGIRMRSLNGK